MSNQTAHMEDPEELNILRAINRGENSSGDGRLETVSLRHCQDDWSNESTYFLYRLRVGTLTGSR